MKVLLLVQREGNGETAWVADAADEYTLEEWNGSLPDVMQKLVDSDPANVRSLWLEIPDNAFDKLWDEPTIKAEVVTGPEMGQS